MAKYRITAPDGGTYEITAPDNASEQDVLSYAQSQFQAQPSGISGQLEQPGNARQLPGQSPMSWGDVPGKALSNLIPSIGGVASGVAQAVMHPIDTLSGIRDVARGAGGLAADKIAGLVSSNQSPPPSPEMQAASNVGQYFANRYGGEEELKRTLAEDPAGVAMDLSAILRGGAGMAGKVPSIAGAAQKVGAVGLAIDPIYQGARGVGYAASKAGPALADIIGGIGTHTGGESLKTAARAGLQGGTAGEVFKANLRGNVPMEDVIAQAKSGLSGMRAERGAAYRQGMGDIAKDTTVLDFAPIDQALSKIEGVKQYKGVDISKSTAETRATINNAIDDWRNLNPAEYHTPEGFDALKQMLGDIRDSTQPGTPSRTIADQAYNAVKTEIVKQAPDYAKVMKGYEEASTQLRDIEKGLSLGERAGADTSLRKLQSVMRNNANTNYGNRVQMAEQLAASGAPNLMEALAGQALSSATPRGLAGKIGGMANIGGAAATMNPALLALLPLQSPRLMGEAAYGLGVAGRGVEKTQIPRLARAMAQRLGPQGMQALNQAAYQTGRIEPNSLAAALSRR